MDKKLKHKSNRVNTGIHFMLGNYAVVEGALAAGCDYFAGYLITPAKEGMRVVDFTLPDSKGNNVTLSDLKGQNIYYFFPLKITQLMYP